MRRLLLSVLALQLVGCGSDSEPNPTPSNATTLATYAKTGSTLLVTRMTGFEAVIPFMLNPGSADAAGLTFNPTGAPNTYTFSAPIDGDGNGSNETTVAGTAAFNGDLAAGRVQLPGRLHMEVGDGQELVLAGEHLALHRGPEHRDRRDVRGENDETVRGGKAGRQGGDSRPS